ncbi:MAG: DUF4339 domain-containing protein [Verrucomicrobiota bacterium]
MSITIYRNAQNYGPYSIDEVKGMLDQKSLSRDDLAWADDAGKWQPVENLVIQESFRRQRSAYIASRKFSSDLRLVG